jgi:eukaryotic-like serine/threonine-protein kinase
MTSAQLRTIEGIFRAALDQQPEQLSAFLDVACEGDEELRRNVETLLPARKKAADFIETSAVELATKIIQSGQAHSLVGQMIGHYKLSELLGSGAMGEVYVATDVTAGRKAALKLLSTRFITDPERLKRFQQEARAVVGLNHPNIVTVYKIGENNAIHYIESELIEGETLRQRLDRGRMPRIHTNWCSSCRKPSEIFVAVRVIRVQKEACCCSGSLLKRSRTNERSLSLSDPSSGLSDGA